jgi:polysaccharide export outer membrane protein
MVRIFQYSHRKLGMEMRSKRTTGILCILAATSMVGCASLPTAGPTTSQVVDQANDQRKNFDFVEVDSHVIAALSSEPAKSFRTMFDQQQAPAGERIGIGDSVLVSIWESLPGGALGTPAPASGATETADTTRSMVIPEQIVGPDGGISIPYAGRVHAAGRAPFQVEQTIDHLLADRMIEPQAIVTVAKNVSDTVTVSGDTMTGARVPLTGRGDRLLDVIATAGGSKSPVYQTSVRLSREGSTVTVPMERLVSDPEENIYARPGDVITVVQEPQTFSVFGATTTNSQVPFGADRVSLAQAIAKAGGLMDSRADPSGVFLFRFEAPPVVDALGLPELTNAPGNATPVVYHLDLHDVGSYFLASRFAVRNDDIVYVANAPLAELQKFFNLIGSITSPVIGGVVVVKGTGN